MTVLGIVVTLTIVSVVETVDVVVVGVGVCTFCEHAVLRSVLEKVAKSVGVLEACRLSCNRGC